MTIGEKVSYIKGLAEGLKVDESTNEGKVITAILDVLGEMAENLAEVDEELDDEMYETTCPTCGNTIRFDYDQAAKGEIDCPNCGAALKFSLDDEDDAE